MFIYRRTKNMTTVMIFVICVLIFVCVSVFTAIFVYKSQMRRKRMQQVKDQKSDSAQ